MEQVDERFGDHLRRRDAVDDVEDRDLEPRDRDPSGRRPQPRSSCARTATPRGRRCEPRGRPPGAWPTWDADRKPSARRRRRGTTRRSRSPLRRSPPDRSSPCGRQSPPPAVGTARRVSRRPPGTDASGRGRPSARARPRPRRPGRIPRRDPSPSMRPGPRAAPASAPRGRRCERRSTHRVAVDPRTSPVWYGRTRIWRLDRSRIRAPAIARARSGLRCGRPARMPRREAVPAGWCSTSSRHPRTWQARLVLVDRHVRAVVHHRPASIRLAMRGAADSRYRTPLRPRTTAFQQVVTAGAVEAVDLEPGRGGESSAAASPPGSPTDREALAPVELDVVDHGADQLLEGLH